MNVTNENLDPNLEATMQPNSMSALLENRDQAARVQSTINRPSSEAGLIALTRRAWKLYDNIFDEGKKINTSPQSDWKTESLHDIRITRQLLRDEIVRHTVDESLIIAIENRLKELYHREITDTTVKFDLSAKAVATMKSLLQILEKNYKIHSTVTLEIMRLPNPSAAFARLINMIIEAPDLNNETESIIKAITELLRHNSFSGYASDALNANLNLAEALKQKLAPMKKYATFLEAIDHAQAMAPEQIYQSTYLPMDATADKEELFMPEHGNLGLDPKPMPTKAKVKSHSTAPKGSPFKRFIKEQLPTTLACIGLIALGILVVAVGGSILGFGLAAIGAGLLKKQYDKKAKEWQTEALSKQSPFVYQDPTPENTPIFTTDHAVKQSPSAQKTADAIVATDDEDEGDGESDSPLLK